MKRTLLLFLSLLLIVSLSACAFAQTEDKTAVRVASLKGPTSMGLAQLMHKENADNDYAFTVAGTADEIVPLLVKGELDIALVPCNLASVLYNNTAGKVSVAAVNTLGVLYIVEVGDSVQSLSDLAGKTVYSTGKGTTPEYALNYVLSKSGLDQARDLTVEYKSEATEVAAALTAGQVSLAMLPQPYVTAVMAQVEGLRVALNLNEVWQSVGGEGGLVTGVVLVNNAFLAEHPEAMASFMAEYADSVAYVNANPAEAAVWIEELGIAKAAIAEKAIPNCNIVCVTGAEMKEMVSGYLDALYSQNPQAVGGTLPDEAFYYLP